MESILDDIYELIRRPKHIIVGIVVGINQYHEVCKEEPRIYNDRKFLGIPIWTGKIESVKIIWGQ